jgi:hypothetical protein
MMGGNGIFSLGLIGPLILFFLGHAASGLLFSGAATIVRFRADSEPAAAGSQRKIDWAIAILVASVLLSILGSSLVRDAFIRDAYARSPLQYEIGTGNNLVIVAWFILWPVSAALTIWGSGAGRRLLLVGHGLIASLLVSLLVGPVIYFRIFDKW